MAFCLASSDPPELKTDFIIGFILTANVRPPQLSKEVSLRAQIPTIFCGILRKRVAIFRRLESLCKDQAATGLPGTTVAQGPPAMFKISTSTTVTPPKNWSSRSAASAYDALLDQCEAIAPSIQDDCCSVKQAVSDVVPENWILKNYNMTTANELVEALTLQNAIANDVIDKVSALFELVLRNHTDAYPDLEHASVLFGFVVDELRPLMLKEERVLFPLVIRLEKAFEFGLNSLLSPFAGLRNPLRETTAEHDVIRNLFRDLRLAMADYDVPVGACSGHALLYSAVRTLDLNIARHFAIEQDVLYPRAIQMEARINLHG